MVRLCFALLLLYKQERLLLTTGEQCFFEVDHPVSLCLDAVQKITVNSKDVSRFLKKSIPFLHR